MTENKEGGTWLAMSKKGKVGVLLNVTGESSDPQKLGRGFLVVDYLKSEKSDKEFLEELSHDGHKYNKYHLVTANFGLVFSQIFKLKFTLWKKCVFIIICEGSIKIHFEIEAQKIFLFSFRRDPGLHHYSNGTNAAGITEITENILGISNSSIHTPFKKAKNGKVKFESILKNFGSVEKKENLVDELLALLKWDEKHYPDEVLDAIETVPLDQRIGLSSVCVSMPKHNYGTRTHTVILVDGNNKVDFYEWTLKEPIDILKPQWIKTHKEFNLVE